MMRGYALTDTLIAMAILTLLLVIVFTRSIDVQTEEMRRARHALLTDMAHAALQLSQHESATGSFSLMVDGQVGQLPSSRYSHLRDLLETFRFPDSNLVLTLVDDARGRRARIDASIESRLIFSQEVVWSEAMAN
jgi:type II secretory pathway component PulJ